MNTVASVGATRSISWRSRTIAGLRPDEGAVAVVARVAEQPVDLQQLLVGLRLLEDDVDLARARRASSRSRRRPRACRRPRTRRTRSRSSPPRAAARAAAASRSRNFWPSPSGRRMSSRIRSKDSRAIAASASARVLATAAEHFRRRNISLSMFLTTASSSTISTFSNGIADYGDECQSVAARPVGSIKLAAGAIFAQGCVRCADSG